MVKSANYKLKQAKRSQTTHKPVNIFNNIQQKQKFPILNNQRNGTVNNRNQSIANQINIRESTLKHEWNTRFSNNKFIDQRITNTNKLPVVHTKYQQRLQQSLIHHTNRNTSTGDSNSTGDSIQLTHNGQHITFDKNNRHSNHTLDPELDDIEYDELLQDYDNDHTVESLIQQQYKTHNNDSSIDNGNSDTHNDSNKHKSKKEVMQEIIDKSKYYKAQKQLQTEQLHHDLMAIDETFDLLRNNNTLFQYKRNVNNELVNDINRVEKDSIDEFILLGKQLSTERKATNVTNGIQPELNRLQDEQQQLIELEQQRVQRMNGMDTNVDDTIKSNKRKHQTNANNITDDSIVDNIAIDRQQNDNDSDSYDDTPAVQDSADESIGDRDESSDGSDVSDDISEDRSLNDTVDESNDYIQSMINRYNTEGDHADDFGIYIPSDNKLKQSVVAQVLPDDSTSDQLSYTYELPNTLKQLLNYMDGQSIDNKQTIFDRILTHNHYHTKPHNKPLFIPYVTTVIQYMVREHAWTMAYVNYITRYIYKIVNDLNSVELTQSMKLLIHTIFNDIKQNNTITIQQLIVCQLYLTIYSATDLNHSLVIPVQLCLTYYCTHIKSITRHNISSILMALSILTQLHESCYNRLYPELLPLLHDLLLYYFNLSLQFKSLSPCPMESFAINTDIDQSINLQHNNKTNIIQLFDAEYQNTTQYQQCCMHMLLNMIMHHTSIYEHSMSYVELFSSIQSVLQYIQSNQSINNHILFNHTNITLYNTTFSKLQSLTTYHLTNRRPLQKFIRPSTIVSQTPVYIDDTSYSSDRVNPVKQRARDKQLLRNMRQTTRSAQRELRRDTQYIQLQAIQDQQQQKQRQQQQQKYVRTIIETQQKDTNILKGKTKKPKL